MWFESTFLIHLLPKGENLRYECGLKLYFEMIYCLKGKNVVWKYILEPFTV